jgi:nitrogen fixation protein NifU and related proteins
MNNLYQEILMDHYRHPRNRVILESPDFSSMSHNPSCGDSVQFEGMINDGCITKLAFQGTGCVISQAMASILSEKLVGKSMSEIQALDKDYVLGILGMQLGPTRLKCAMLPVLALQEGINQC